MAKRKKGIYGMSEDVSEVGAGVFGALVINFAVNKLVSPHHHGEHHPGGDNEPGEHHAGNNPVNDFVGEISGKMGMPKPMVIKGGIAIGLLFMAEKMPQHKTMFLFASAILAYDAITTHPKVRHFIGMHGVDGTEALNAIEDEVRKEISEYKAICAELGVMEGTTLADHMEGQELAEEMHGQTLAANFHMEGTNQFASLGL